MGVTKGFGKKPRNRNGKRVGGRDTTVMTTEKERREGRDRETKKRVSGDTVGLDRAAAIG